MIEYLDEDEKFRRIDEALAKTLERFERQGILRSEIREGLWTTAAGIRLPKVLSETKSTLGPCR